MARYNVHDLIGHFVAPRSARGKMCPHACCRNKRVHPANMPVILPNRLLRRASDDDLAAHWDRTTGNEEAHAQILWEMQRRDMATDRREAAEERRRQRGPHGSCSTTGRRTRGRRRRCSRARTPG